MPRDGRRERKVVTVLFCDLVGFTSRAESMDPEDVEALLRPYHERVRSELERHGGTVEKFIGDAVMALFGAPTAHEDDPERAVRAALAIRDFAADEGLELRIGVTTGEALVRLDAQPEAGEGMASGDVVNTAARLQSAAPVNGVLVDETTYRATRHAIDHDAAAPVEAKGKVEPVAVWRALAAHSRFGVDVAHEARTELVGRERELGVLREAFERARHERTPQLVTLVGVPGIGKSRLVYELSRIADADPELVTWRQGRCLAYGEGVTLWALGEIVKAQAGIVEQDADEDVEHKLHKAVADVLADTADESWVQTELRSLVGLSVDFELGDDRRGAAFAAWRRFLEAMAEQRPLVLVFEDLHWADESLLDFVDELVDWVTDVPLLVVCTARPELLERRPGWGGGKLNATTLALAPLADGQTARMIALLLDRPVLSAESQQALLERAGGNPLYAEQFAELYLERGSADELPLPETLQGIIAARLDSLSPVEKDLLQDAAVVGKVFWASSLGSDPAASTATLHALDRKGFVRRQKRSSVENESEFAFAHALVRDVAYGQIARADRATRHRRVAEWIQDLGRPEDHAEMLAHHWLSASDLAQASGAPDDDAAERARIALRDAGDRALALNAFAAAEAYYAQALGLWPADDTERPRLLFQRAFALYSTGDERRADALAQARDALLATGDRQTAAEAEVYLSRAAWYGGDRGEADAHMAAAEELVAGIGPSAAKARVLAFSARLRMLAGDPDDVRIASEALVLAEELDLDELKIHALTTIGGSKNRREPMSGHADLGRAVEIGKAVNSPLLPTALNNVGVGLSGIGDIPGTDKVYHEALRIAERLGDHDMVRFTRGNLFYTGFFLGRWDDVYADATAFIDECETSPHYMEGAARLLRAYIRLARGDFDGARADWERSLEQGRAIQDPQRLLPALLQAARGNALLSRDREARELATEALGYVRQHPELAGLLGQIARVARQLGIREQILELVADAPASIWTQAAQAEASGDFVAAAELFAERGAIGLEAEDRLCAAIELFDAGQHEEAVQQAEKALTFYRSVGATFSIEQAEQVLARAQRESA
ncbi:MAG TPA: adenylate/guanylate cyclase domain-containing protein [Gaiellaceae bacterium]|nr:adenylate/guanylate cyclase domain-containing protein [Gaiellaceae bacterium]